MRAEGGPPSALGTRHWAKKGREIRQGLPAFSFSDGYLATIDAMNCPRCQNLMVTDRCEDIWDETGTLTFLAWRCVTCGELIDPTILSNRALRHAPSVRHKPRRKSPIALR